MGCSHHCFRVDCSLVWINKCVLLAAAADDGTQVHASKFELCVQSVYFSTLYRSVSFLLQVFALIDG